MCHIDEAVIGETWLFPVQTTIVRSFLQKGLSLAKTLKSAPREANRIVVNMEMVRVNEKSGKKMRNKNGVVA